MAWARGSLLSKLAMVTGARDGFPGLVTCLQLPHNHYYSPGLPRAILPAPGAQAKAAYPRDAWGAASLGQW